MTYEERQNALAATPGGKLAASMTPGSRWKTPRGKIATVWMAWRPGTAADEARAKRHGSTLCSEHNTEIGVTIDGERRPTARIKVESLSKWKPVSG